MALADVKIYFKQLEAQRNEMQADLADFEKAMRQGYITEDRLEDVKADFAIVDTNYQRVAYLIWLFEIPARKKQHKTKKQRQAAYIRKAKAAKHYAQDKELINKFSLAKSDMEAVLAENENVLLKFKEDLNKLIDNK